MNNFENRLEKKETKKINGIRLMQIKGISIELDYSWFIIAAFLTFVLSTGAAEAFSLNFIGALSIGLLVVMAFFGSLLLHELSHAFVARKRGIEVDNIRLFILGGAANIKREPRTAFEEFAISIAGPLMSFALAGLFGLGYWAVGASNVLVAWALSYLTFVNLSLAIFNLLPIFPLDGGRVLRSIIWAINKDFVKATRISSMVGRAGGWLFVGLGFWLVLEGFFLNGLVFMMMGWFISNAAAQSYRQAVLERSIKGLQVGQVMNRPTETILPDAPIAQLVYEYFVGRGYKVVAVVEQGYLAGLVSEANLRQIAPTDWNTTRVSDVMTRRMKLPIAYVNDDVEATIRKMVESQQMTMPVLNSENYFVGLFSYQDVANYIRVTQQWRQGGGYSRYNPITPNQNIPQPPIIIEHEQR